MNKVHQISAVVALCLGTLLAGCGNSDTAVATAPQDQASAQTKAAEAAQKGLAQDAINKQASEAEAARHMAQNK